MGIFSIIETKSAWKKALKKQYIRVDNKIASTATVIRGGEVLELCLPEETNTKKAPVLPLDVLYEDEYLAAIHKPAGILVSGNKFLTIANALTQNLLNSKLQDASRPQPVHRLDYPTTGILLVGKTSSSIRKLNKLFENNELTKTYYAITIGKMKPKGQICSTIDNKKSISNYSLYESVHSERFGRLNLVKLEPLTGRTHQLRKHLLSIGSPILGDQDYGIEDLILKGKGLYLHAYSLKFVHPFTNEKMYLFAELPPKFRKIFPEIGAGD